MSTSQQRERGKTLQVRLSEAELERIAADAQAAGLSLSGYARAQLLGAVTPRTRKAAPLPAVKLLAQIFAALGKIGSNMNQLARAVNQGQSVETKALAVNLAAAIEDVQAAAEDIRRTLR